MGHIERLNGAMWSARPPVVEGNNAKFEQALEERQQATKVHHRIERNVACSSRLSVAARWPCQCSDAQRARP